MDLKSKTKFWIRQFPFIFPGKIIYSCRDWIDDQRKKKGQYFSQRGPWYKTIFAESFINNEPPQTLGTPNEKAFYNNRAYPVSSSTLFYLQNSYVLGHKGLVLTVGHQVFQEFSHHFGIATFRKFLWKNPFYIVSNSVKRVPGIGALLVSPESHNYYHWLNDVLPRIKLYESVLDQIDHFCIASNVPAKFLDILPQFGIAKDKILLIQAKEKLHFDYLYVSSLPGSEGRSPKWAVDFISEKLLKIAEPPSACKKIYFKRGTNTERKIVNEDSTITMLQNDGYEIIEPDKLTIPQQIDLMQQAKVVVSAHGAALSNLLFSNNKTIVIEIFSPDYFRTDCYYTLSSIKKLNYWYIIGNKPPGVNWGDIEVPEDLLLKTIRQANG